MFTLTRPLKTPTWFANAMPGRRHTQPSSSRNTCIHAWPTFASCVRTCHWVEAQLPAAKCCQANHLCHDALEHSRARSLLGKRKLPNEKLLLADTHDATLYSHSLQQVRRRLTSPSGRSVAAWQESRSTLRSTESPSSRMRARRLSTGQSPGGTPDTRPIGYLS